MSDFPWPWMGKKVDKFEFGNLSFTGLILNKFLNDDEFPI